MNSVLKVLARGRRGPDPRSAFLQCASAEGRRWQGQGHATLGEAEIDEPDDRPTTPWIRTVVSGVDMCRHPKYNKGLAFSEEERDRLYLRGLLPPAILSQVERVMINIRGKLTSDLDKHNYLMSLQERNERLFYRVLTDNIEELLPIVDLPTVGAYCQKHGLMFRSVPRGLYIGLQDKGRVFSILKNWPERRVKAICLTDGERVGSLGDLGVQAVGAAISKLSLYTACAGIPPSVCLPICLDAGTDNEELLDSPFYVGARQQRVRGEAYDELLQELLDAVRQRFGGSTLIHMQDMTYLNLARFLDEYRGSFPVFSDDIQGMAAVIMAGIIAAQPLTGKRLSDHTYIFAGEGRGATAMAEMIATAIARETGETIYEARSRIWLVDTHGLVTRDRGDADTLDDHKLLWARSGPSAPDVQSAIEAVRPSVYVDVASMGDCLPLPRAAAEQLAAGGARPLIFALTQPGVLSPQDAYEWTNGQCIFADRELARSSTETVELSDGQRRRPGVCRTAYVFPGIGLGVTMSRSTRIRDEMIIAAAHALANLVTDEDRAAGCIYPNIGNIRNISLHIAKAVAVKAYDAGVATELPRPRNLFEYARDLMYQPTYRRYR